MNSKQISRRLDIQRFFHYELRETVVFDVVYKYDTTDDVVCNNGLMERVRNVILNTKKYFFNLITLLISTSSLLMLMVITGTVFIICDVPLTISIPVLSFILLITYVPTQLLIMQSSHYVVYSVKISNEEDKMFQFNCIDNIIKTYPVNNSGVIERIKAFQKLVLMLTTHQDNVISNHYQSMADNVLSEIEKESTNKMKRIGIFNIKFNDYGK